MSLLDYAHPSRIRLMLALMLLPLMPVTLPSWRKLKSVLRSLFLHPRRVILLIHKYYLWNSCHLLSKPGHEVTLTFFDSPHGVAVDSRLLKWHPLEFGQSVVCSFHYLSIEPGSQPSIARRRVAESASRTSYLEAGNRQLVES